MIDDQLTSDSDEWSSVREPMTQDQRVYLDTLAQQTGEPTPGDNLTKDEADLKIAELSKEAGVELDNDDDLEMGDDDRSQEV